MSRLNRWVDDFLHWVQVAIAVSLTLALVFFGVIGFFTYAICSNEGLRCTLEAAHDRKP